MLLFINIKTEEVFKISDWAEVISRGGLKNCLPSDQWKDIWELKAALENIGLGFSGHNNHSVKESFEAIKCFKKNISSDLLLACSRRVSTPG